MRNRKLFAWAGILLGGLVALAPQAMAQSKSAAKSAPKAQTGYVASMGESALVLSNIPTGSGGGPTGAPGGRGGFQVQIGPGDVVRGPDGKLSLSPEAKKRFTPEQAKTVEETLNSQPQGGNVIVRKGPEGKTGTRVPPGKAPAPGVPLQLTDFVLDKKTKKPADLGRGDKVTVTYVEAAGKKVATRIEKAK